MGTDLADIAADLVDIAAEAARLILPLWRTGLEVISEEDASEFGTPDAIGARFFLVDPLDGTKAFVRGDPHFTVNIGLIDHGKPVAGVVAAPASGELWVTTAAGVVKRH